MIPSVGAAGLDLDHEATGCLAETRLMGAALGSLLAGNLCRVAHSYRCASPTVEAQPSVGGQQHGVGEAAAELRPTSGGGSEPCCWRGLPYGEPSSRDIEPP